MFNSARNTTKHLMAIAYNIIYTRNLTLGKCTSYSRRENKINNTMKTIN